MAIITSKFTAIKNMSDLLPNENVYIQFSLLMKGKAFVM